jgi:hypothetical protein
VSAQVLHGTMTLGVEGPVTEIGGRAQLKPYPSGLPLKTYVPLGTATTKSPRPDVLTVATVAPVFADSTRTLPGVALHLPVVAPVRDQI